MTNEELLSVAEIVDRLVTRLHRQAAEHEAKMVEHRAAFGVRTEADAKIIAGLREESAKYKAERDHFYQREGIEQKRRMDVESERDGLQTQVQDMRAEMERLQMEVAALKSQTPKHPAKVGEWVRRNDSGYDDAPHGYIASVLGIQSVGMDYTYTVIDQSGNRVPWSSAYCEPCDPPTEATHDTPTGKQVAEAAVKTEPVAEEIKVGDLVEVVSNRGRNTWLADVGSLGTVTGVEEINESISVHLDYVPGKKNALAGYVSLCDVRKVTT